MKTSAKFELDAKVDVLVGELWIPAVVCWIGAWSDNGGNENPVYQVEFVDGSGKIMCGQNSVRERGKGRRIDK